MMKRKFDELISYFNLKVSKMNIDRKYKMELLGMITAIGLEHEKEMPHWIPCSERLPEDNTVCLVTVDQYYIPSYVNQVDVMIYDSGKWLFYNVDDIDTDKTCLIPIIAWMPLPEVYREGD